MTSLDVSQMLPTNSTDDLLPEALRDALGKIIAEQRREWRRERELMTAQAETTIANLRANMIERLDKFDELAERQLIDAMTAIANRLASLQDGKPGVKGDQGAQGEPGLAGKDGAPGLKGDPGEKGDRGEQGIPGKDGESIKGDPGEKGEKGDTGEKGTDGAFGAPGKDGAKGERGEQGIQGERGLSGSQGEKGERGERGEQGPEGQIGKAGEIGKQGEKGERGEQGNLGFQGPPGISGTKGDKGDRGEPGERGERGERGAIGETGPQGSSGYLPEVKVWHSETVHYKCEVVVHDGTLWQAVRDTGQKPGHKDWICLASSGRDGISPVVCGTYNVETVYKNLSIVALNGGSFIAKRNDPGPCPGDGWQLLTSQGKSGKPGEPGPKGERGLKGDKGLRGEPGDCIVSWEVDRGSYVAIPILSTGAKGPTLELRSLFEQFQNENAS